MGCNFCNQMHCCCLRCRDLHNWAFFPASFHTMQCIFSGSSKANTVWCIYSLAISTEDIYARANMRMLTHFTQTCRHESHFLIKLNLISRHLFNLKIIHITFSYIITTNITYDTKQLTANLFRVTGKTAYKRRYVDAALFAEARLDTCRVS